MYYIAAVPVIGGRLVLQNLGEGYDYGGEAGVTITFNIHGKSRPRESQKIIENSFESNNTDWIFYRKPHWILKSEIFKKVFDLPNSYDWLIGDVILDVDHENTKETIFDRESDKTYIRFLITPESINEQMPKKIFLSHKGIDKPIVRDYMLTLKSIGFDVWLDEDSMAAGAELERALLRGFNDSCAAIFFITPNYIDKDYLATEINYSIAEKCKKGDRFAIITLLLNDVDSTKAEVPPLLKQYVWKEPKDSLEAIREIIKELPIQQSSADWKAKF
jgi:hypothetical protein